MLGSPQMLPAGTASATIGRAVYSPRETELILGVSHATLYRLITTGRLDARKLGSKTLITASSIERLLAELPSCRRSAQGDEA